MSNEQGGRGPDYGIATLLRGYPNFEDLYQGVTRKIPLALSTYGSPNMGRDAAAASNYAALSNALSKQSAGTGTPADGAVDGATSPNLLAGHPVTLGADIIFLLPRPLAGTYTYKIVWRGRSVDGYAETRLPYHLPYVGQRYQDARINTNEGFNSTSPVYSTRAAGRVPLASVEEVIRVTQPAGTGDLAPLGLQLTKDAGVAAVPEFAYPGTFPPVVGPDGVWNYGPILPFAGGNAIASPSGRGSYVFGEYGQNPLTSLEGFNNIFLRTYAAAFRNAVSHVSFTTKAKGDEAIVLLYPDLAGTGEYDFDDDEGGDAFVSLLFGRGGFDGLAGTGPVFPNGIPFGVYIIPGF